MIRSHFQKIFIFGFFIIIGLILFWIETTSPKNISQNNFQPETVKIEQVFDGDTFSAKINGVNEKIRILGIDTPEVSGGYREGECFGENASVFTKKTLAGKSVMLISSKTGDQTDQYGRLLRYVELNNEDIGKTLIAEGYAESYKKFPHDRKQEYNSLEKKAKSEKKGLWGSCK